ncbi:PREDICTED: uncharacterized protein LOC104804019 [Tarenaya hassleriana]|uniref:uncharacterized protein LOC104804019 n=1 Tax=Tarenaya hassleriana TaxID=28532 RepID=UPI00053C3443|nr:PREDICTED: uncharacterized protein LOC104804019 [Tarenaya hassleriana]XP_010526457.1 PREDICTED: uncharacterized protein LOC104804019 [Tarenaya hassleriana]
MTTPAIPSSIGNVSLIPRATFSLKTSDCSVKCGISRKPGKQSLSSLRVVLPLSTSLRLFPAYARQYVLHPRFRTSATGTDVVVEEQDSSAADENSGGEPVEASEKSEESPATTSQSRRARMGRKSEMPPVKNEELVPGVTFTGKVRAIQPFGAFVDFGAFTDGLVHVSQLSDNFVKDVSSVVSIGQEVKVRLVEADFDAGRISLSMRENDDTPKRQSGSDKPRPPRKNPSKTSQRKEDLKTSKFMKGQMLEGTVKNLTRSGAFISLPEGEEGFLPTAEEADDGLGSMMGSSSLQAGQEVSVRVLRISRGQVTLTMKSEDGDKFDETLNEGVVYTATNPFVLAFRKNKDIASFLDKRAEEVEKEAAEKPEETPPNESDEVIKDIITSNEINESLAGTEESTNELSESSEEITEQILSSETPKEEEVVETKAEDDLSAREVQTAESEELEQIPDDNGSVMSSEAKPDVPPIPETKDEEENSTPLNSTVDEVSPSETPASEEVEKKEVVAEAPVVEAEAHAPAPVVAEASSEENGNIDADSSSPNGSIKGSISPALVKQLRDETGAGMMDCKKALSETGGDIVKAQEYLRKKGLASAEKKASRATAEGRIGAYIHDSRIGVLLEVNCETDFVSRGEIFKELVDDLAMQVAACPQVEYLVTEDVPEEIVNKEKEMEMQKEDLLSKPEQIREKIVEGRIKKRLETLTLLEQPYIKNDKVTVKDWVKQTIATVGENIKVKRFTRYNLGEGLEKKSQDFAAEVAAQTAAKPKAEPEKEQPKAEEPKETAVKAASTAVSAALVKQLREETGAGMMDCKKALAETGGDLEKAQEYLRKKGLSTADKKSSRLAAEGRIGSYIHDSRIGVLIEVNCETDFVGRSEKFKELVDDLAMQAVANPQVQYISIEDIPEEIRNNEKEIEMQREDILSKPDNIKEKIVEGRVSKRLGELALLEQPYIKDDSVLVKDLVKQTVAAIGENIKVRRFMRFTLGEDN